MRGRGELVGSTSDDGRGGGDRTKRVVLVVGPQAGKDSDLGRQWGRVNARGGYSGESTVACRVSGTSRQGGPQWAGESPNYLVGHRMRRVPHERVEDLRRGGGQKPAETSVGEFARSSGDENKRIRFDGGMTGAAGEVGQGCHAAHGVPCEGEWAFNAKRYEQRGQIVGELLDAVSVHGRVRGVAMAAMVVTDDPNVIAPLADKLTDLNIPRRLI